jgi:hypothetical protein
MLLTSKFNLRFCSNSGKTIYPMTLSKPMCVQTTVRTCPFLSTKNINNLHFVPDNWSQFPKVSDSPHDVRLIFSFSFHVNFVKLSRSCAHFMYRQFNIQQFYVLPTHCIYVFCMDLRKKTAVISLYNID